MKLRALAGSDRISPQVFQRTPSQIYQASVDLSENPLVLTRPVVRDPKRLLRADFALPQIRSGTISARLCLLQADRSHKRRGVDWRYTTPGWAATSNTGSLPFATRFCHTKFCQLRGKGKCGK